MSCSKFTFSLAATGAQNPDVGVALDNGLHMHAHLYWFLCGPSFPKSATPEKPPPIKKTGTVTKKIEPRIADGSKHPKTTPHKQNRTPALYLVHPTAQNPENSEMWALRGMSEHLRFGRTPLWAVSTDAEERKRRHSTKNAKSYVQVGLRCAPRLAYKPV